MTADLCFVMPPTPRPPLRRQKPRREPDQDTQSSAKRTTPLIIEQLQELADETATVAASPVFVFVQMLLYFVRAVDNPQEQDRKGRPLQVLSAAAYRQFMRHPLLATAQATNDTWGLSGSGKLQPGITAALDEHPILRVEAIQEPHSAPCAACGEVQPLSACLTLDGRAYNLETQLAATVVVESQLSALPAPITLFVDARCCARLCSYHDAQHFVLHWLLRREDLKTVSGVASLLAEVELVDAVCREFARAETQ